METQRWIAFLRAINVGGHTVKMDTLRALFEALGTSNVETFIASGNVIFTAAAVGSLAEQAAMLEAQIERHLKQSLGFEVDTFLRTPTELAAAATCQPFSRADLQTETHSLYIAFLKAPLNEPTQQKILAYRTPVEDFNLQGRELYWLRRRNLGESNFSGAILEKTLRMPTTVRNATTVRKLSAKYPADPGSSGQPRGD